MTRKNYMQCVRWAHNQYVGPRKHTHTHMYTYILLTGLLCHSNGRMKGGPKKGKSLAQSNDTFSLLVLPDNDINESCFGSGQMYAACVHVLYIMYTYSSSRMFINKEHCRRRHRLM